MIQSYLKPKAIKLWTLLVKIALVGGPVLLLTLISTRAANAASPIQLNFLQLLSPATAQCYPVPTQGSSPFDGAAPLSINPVDWIGWVLGQLCKAVATVFFSLTNQVINWGSGCSQAGLNFVTQTPNYIRLDAGKADNWQLFFWDGRFIGAALLLQFCWTVFSIIWNRQAGNGYGGAQEIITRTLLGAILLIIGAGLLDWAVNFCNLLNSLFADRLSLFDPNSFQVDGNGNIFNTVLSMAAALASLLLVMQMATRYIYLILLQFIFPIGIILWTNRGTQGYARLIFTSLIATLFVQPLQLAVIYITSNLKDGTRDDTSLSMLFGICGLFLTLGLPRVMGSVLGGGTPVGAWGIFAIGRIAAGGAAGVVRGVNRTNGGNNGNGNGQNNFGGRNPSPSGGGGGYRGGGGANQNSKSSGSLPATPSSISTKQTVQAPTSSTSTNGNDPGTGSTIDPTLRHGGMGQGALRNPISNNHNKNEQPALTDTYSSADPSKSTPLAEIPLGGVQTKSNPLKATSPVNGLASSGNIKPNLAGGGSTTPVSATPQLSQNPTDTGPTSTNQSGPTTIFRNRNGLVSRSAFGKANTEAPTLTQTPVGGITNPSGQNDSLSGANPPTSIDSHNSIDKVISPGPTSSRGQPGGFRPAPRRTQSAPDLKESGD